MKKLTLITSLLLISAVVIADEIAVTVYNSNLGVISEKRTLKFDKGIGRLQFRDVPSLIDANSVGFTVEGNRSVSILEQNYAFDLVSPDKMYQKYIDKEIELIDKQGKLYQGTLLAFNSGAITIQEKSGRIKIVLLSHVVEVNFPSLPDGLITRPTLFWKYDSDFSGEALCEVSYQTSGISWSAEYVGLLNSEETQLDLSGWAAINNSSGKTYKDAKLKLVAGDIHRAQQYERVVLDGYARKTLSAAAPGFQEKVFFEYHLYTLPRKATVADKEIKQISLFEPASAKVKKVFVYEPERNPKQVQVKLRFKNTPETGLGMPLPAGRIRIFKADDDGSRILLGEDRIKHTPINEELNITVGNAFDIAAEERIMNQNRISQKIEDRDMEIEIRNRKAEAVTIEVVKKLYGFWEILESDFEYEKKDANTIQFEIKAKANEKVLVKYKVRYNYR